MSKEWDTKEKLIRYHAEVAQRFEFTVPTDMSGRRIDQIIPSQIPALSRTRTKRILAEGGVFVDKKRVKVAGRPLHAGQGVVVHYNEHLLDMAPAVSDAAEIPIVELTDEYVVVNKPSGMFSTPTPESDRNDALFFLGQSLKAQNLKHELYVVHRLDRPTSGLMIFARTKSAAARLSQGMESHTIDRKYLALVLAPTADNASITKDIGGKMACTHFSVLERKGPLALVHAALETGRTHQVRIHAEQWGAPILGDSKYGRALLRQRLLEQGVQITPAPRLALHAAQLRVPTLFGADFTEYECSLPPDLRAYWDAMV